MIRTLRPLPVKNIKLILFDLDGTLIDSELDLVAAVNAMLLHYGRKELPLEVIGTYIGDGAPMLIRRALGDPAHSEFLQEALNYFLLYYREHKLDSTRPYDGINKMLQQARQGDGVPRKLAVLRVVAVGANPLMREAGAAPGETVMVGDSGVDVLTARNAGLWSVGVNYGFAPLTLQQVPPDVLVDTPAELARVLSVSDTAKTKA